MKMVLMNTTTSLFFNGMLRRRGGTMSTCWTSDPREAWFTEDAEVAKNEARQLSSIYKVRVTGLAVAITLYAKWKKRREDAAKEPVDNGRYAIKPPLTTKERIVRQQSSKKLRYHVQVRGKKEVVRLFTKFTNGMATMPAQGAKKRRKQSVEVTQHEGVAA